MENRLGFDIKKYDNDKEYILLSDIKKCPPVFLLFEQYLQKNNINLDKNTIGIDIRVWQNFEDDLQASRNITIVNNKKHTLEDIANTLGHNYYKFKGDKNENENN